MTTSITPPSPASAITYTWDNNGDLTNRGSDTFAWDYEDRMTSATVNSATTTVAYRGDGLRDSRTMGGVTTTFTWDIAGGLPVVLGDGAKYVYGAGLVSQVSGANSYYYLADGLGSTMKTVDASGTVVNGYTYDIYGKKTSSTGSQANEFDFAGQQTDPTGLQYLRARYYDPETGTFASRDPMSASNGWTANPLGYAGGNPVNRADPTGLYWGESKVNKVKNVASQAGGAVAGAATDVATEAKQAWDAASPALTQCAIWGAAGAALGGGVQGAAAGCAAGIGSYVIDQYLGSNPLSQCLNWGTAGAVTAGLAGAAAGCAAGAASWVDTNYGPGDRYSECGIWGAAGGATAGAPGFVLGCLAGAASTDAADLFKHRGTNPPNSSLREKR